MSAHLPRVVKVITTELPVRPIGEIHQDTTMDSLRVDLLDRSMIAVAIEDEFGVTIPGGCEENWTTVGSICEMLEHMVPA